MAISTAPPTPIAPADLDALLPRADRVADLLRTDALSEIQGARATSTARGFDRPWRTVRTPTVHDPVAYEAREVGDWVLGRRGPELSLDR